MFSKNRINFFKNHKFIVYPYFLGLFSILNTLSANVLDIPPGQSLRAILLVFIVTSLFLIITFFITKNWHRATLVSSLAVFIIFSYGQIYRLLDNFKVLGLDAGQHYILLPTLSVIIVIIVTSYFKNFYD